MQDITKAILDLLSKMAPYISVPLLVAYGVILFVIIKLIGKAKDERIAAARELSDSKEQRILQLQKENEALRQRDVDPNKLLAEVSLIRLSTEERVENAKRRLDEALERLQAKESEVADVRTAHNALVDELNRARERAEALSGELHSYRLNSERSELLRIQEAIMHEILSPVMGIVGHAELLLRHRNDLSPEQHEQKLKDIISEGMLLRQLAASWRFRSRQDISLAPSKTLIRRDILLPTVETLTLRARQHDVDIRINASPELPAVLLDADAFRQAMLNILDNAIKYSHRGNHVDFLALTTEEGVTIDVENKGLTIASDAAERIFLAGYRDANGVRHDPTGTGFGLFVARKLFMAQGCDLILLQTEPITVFRVKIPKRLFI
jgi:signal transduction histidine kinase